MMLLVKTAAVCNTVAIQYISALNTDSQCLPAFCMIKRIRVADIYPLNLSLTQQIIAVCSNQVAVQPKTAQPQMGGVPFSLQSLPPL